jgi:hypothetical protein
VLKCPSIYYNQIGFIDKKTIKNVIIPSEWCTSIHDSQNALKEEGGFFLLKELLKFKIQLVFVTSIFTFYQYFWTPTKGHGLIIGNIVAAFMSLKEKTKRIMVASLFVNQIPIKSHPHSGYHIM